MQAGRCSQRAMRPRRTWLPYLDAMWLMAQT